jgi:large subunit ribosomal protein L21
MTDENTNVVAVVKTQGQQFTVKTGDVLKVMRYPNVEAGATVKLDEVLLYKDASGVRFGAPKLEDVTVCAKVLENKRDKKVTILKHRRRGGFQRKQGFRQALSVIKIESIDSNPKKR